jgi:hypothetical protein
VDELEAKFDEFTLVSYLSTSIVTRSVWYVDSGASHHMIESLELFNSMKNKDSRIYVDLSDDAKYAVKEERTILCHIESGCSFEAKDMLYVPGLRKNFLSISVMKDKGFVVTFKKGKVLIHPKGDSLDTIMRIGVREDKLYELKGNSVYTTLVHDSDNLCEIWHMRMGHFHYRALLILTYISIGLSNFIVEQQGICRGCALGKNVKATFPRNESRSNGTLDLIHSDVCGSCQ